VPVISDSSPLILYASIERLDLLRALFGEVMIPPAVWEEVVTEGSGRAGAPAVAEAPWIIVRPVVTSETVKRLSLELDRGEAETIALAEQFDNYLTILLDDRKARRLARERSLQVLGSAGVLVLAKDRGLIPLVGPVLDELRSAGLYLSDVAYRELLAISDE
jgi:uncharacterized protein